MRSYSVPASFKPVSSRANRVISGGHGCVVASKAVQSSEVSKGASPKTLEPSEHAGGTCGCSSDGVDKVAMDVRPDGATAGDSHPSEPSKETEWTIFDPILAPPPSESPQSFSRPGQPPTTHPSSEQGLEEPGHPSFATSRPGVHLEGVLANPDGLADPEGCLADADETVETYLEGATRFVDQASAVIMHCSAPDHNRAGCSGRSSSGATELVSTEEGPIRRFSTCSASGNGISDGGPTVPRQAEVMDQHPRPIAEWEKIILHDGPVNQRGEATFVDTWKPPTAPSRADNDELELTCESEDHDKVIANINSSESPVSQCFDTQAPEDHAAPRCVCAATAILSIPPGDGQHLSHLPAKGSKERGTGARMRSKKSEVLSKIDRNLQTTVKMMSTCGLDIQTIKSILTNISEREAAAGLAPLSSEGKLVGRHCAESSSLWPCSGPEALSTHHEGIYSKEESRDPTLPARVAGSDKRAAARASSTYSGPENTNLTSKAQASCGSSFEAGFEQGDGDGVDTNGEEEIISSDDFLYDCKSNLSGISSEYGGSEPPKARTDFESPVYLKAECIEQQQRRGSDKVLAAADSELNRPEFSSLHLAPPPSECASEAGSRVDGVTIRVSTISKSTENEAGQIAEENAVVIGKSAVGPRKTSHEMVKIIASVKREAPKEWPAVSETGETDPPCREYPVLIDDLSLPVSTTKAAAEFESQAEQKQRCSVCNRYEINLC
eukprot:GHVU01089374.1.p1 GENE.GHVU01089374.1~~GHVU01089374.1.p1  ORF type:complete len:725 (+),score=75.95 GHVU01089374.1:590-2764(+)